MATTTGTESGVPAPVPGSRIISLAPSLTETLFALGLGERVVGVTDYCRFPPEVASKTRIGGFIDPSLEAIVALRPDLVVVLPDHREIRGRLEQLGLQVLAVPQYTVTDILDSLTLLGRRCGAEPAALAVRKRISDELYSVEKLVSNRQRPRVALAVGHELTGSRLDQACLAGPKSYLHELIERAGGTNALGESFMTYPSLSREGLSKLNPEVVIDLVPEPGKQPGAVEAIRAAWKSVPGVQAGQDDRIFVLDSDIVAIPGPRVGEVVRTMARLLHPEAGW